MHIVTTDRRNYRNLDHIISALEPGTEEPGDGSGLVVTMLRGDPVTLRGAQAEAFRSHLLAVAVEHPPAEARAPDPGVHGHSVMPRPRPAVGFPCGPSSLEA